MREKRSAAKGMYAASMVIFGTLGLFTRHIPVSSGELALYRAVLAFLLVGLFLAVSRQKLDWKDAKREIGLLLVSGAAWASTGFCCLRRTAIPPSPWLR